MYFIRESDIINWTKKNELEFINCACDFTKTGLHEQGKRIEIKKLIEELRKKDANIDYNIFKSMENVNLECILGYKYKSTKMDFNDIYEEEEDK